MSPGPDLGSLRKCHPNQLATYVHDRRSIYERILLRQALLRPEGLAGAAVAGFYIVLTAPHPARVFVEPSEAFAWLGAEHEVQLVEGSKRFARRQRGRTAARRRVAQLGAAATFALLQSDVTVLRDDLGHASIATTGRYLTTNLAMKREVLKHFWETAHLPRAREAVCRPAPALVAFLPSL